MSTTDHPYKVEVIAFDGDGYTERAATLDVAIEIAREAYRAARVENVAIAYGGVVIAADVYEIEDLEGSTLTEVDAVAL